MNCPVCEESMIIMELNEVEIDHCLTCKGIWLDAGELELLLESAAGKDELLASFEAVREAKEKARPCPICDKRMTKIWVGKEEKVMVDRCPKKDGIWFDQGELDEIIALGSLGEDNRVLDLLKDMFGQK